MDSRSHSENSNSTLNQGFPADTPVAPPSDFFPPEPPVHHSKNFLTGKLIAAVLGMAVLAGGLGAGVVLVQQPQRAESLAYLPAAPLPICGPGLKCQTGKFGYYSKPYTYCSALMSNGTYAPYYCCNDSTNVIVDNKCVTGCPADTKQCGNYIGGVGSPYKCWTAAGKRLYCCPTGKVHTNAGCENPLVNGGACTYAPAGVNTKKTLTNVNNCYCETTYTCTSNNTYSSDGKCYAVSGITTSACMTNSCFVNGVWDFTKAGCN